MRMSSADPMRSTSASATSTITRIDRTLFCLNPLPERPLLSFSVVVRSAFELCSAGINPKMMPVMSDNPRVKVTTRQSIPTSAPSSPTRGRPAVLTDNSARIPSHPNSRPNRPPAIESRMLSVSSCRMIRPREPPTAARMAISRRRPVARARRRFATFAQAISSTRLTAPTSTSSDVRTPRTSKSLIRSTPKLLFCPNVGNFERKSAADARSRAFACSMRDPRLQPSGHPEVVPGFPRVGIELPRRPDLWRRAELREVEIVEHTDDRVGLAVECDGPAADIGVVPEAAPPQRLADHDDLRCIGEVFVSAERPADGDRRTHELEEVRRDPARLQLFRKLAAGVVHDPRGVGRHVLQHVGLGPPVHELGRRGRRT